MNSLTNNLPVIVMTGASGFVGRCLIRDLKEEYYIYALARRTQEQVKIPHHKNIKWVLVDIANEKRLAFEIDKINNKSNVDFVIHLAGYYDFGNKPNPEYERTNVLGTKNILEQTKKLNLKRLLFSSSIAACNFPEKGEVITEKTPLDADFPYAITKRKAEQLIREYSQFYPCSIVRFAAVYSDWCEYGPLYMFLKTWSSKSWNSKILGGKGESAVPYIHESCLNKLIKIILTKTDELPQIDTYIASPNGSSSHLALFNITTKLFFGEKKRPIKMPIILAQIGVRVRYWLGSLISRPPFERPWMLEYVDRKLDTDATYTMNALNWTPSPLKVIERRLLYLMEHMRSLPIEWFAKNQVALKMRSSERPNLLISNALMTYQEQLTNNIFNHIFKNGDKEKYIHYQLMSEEYLTWYINVIYNLIITSVRTGNRLSLVNYAHTLAVMRKKEGFAPVEVSNAITETGNLIIEHLIQLPELDKFNDRIRDTIGLSIQMMVDEILDTYENH